MKDIKKRLILTLVLTISVIIMGIIPAFAVDKVTVKLDIAGNDGKIYVRLTAPENSDIATVSASLNFDKSKLDFSDISYLSGSSIVSMTDDKNAENGSVTANIVLADSLTEKSKIFTYVFDVKDGAKGELNFDFAKIEATNSNNEKLELIFDGANSVKLDEIEPLTPDVTQSDFGKPSETQTAAEPESESQQSPDKADTPNIPSTSGRIIAFSVIGICAAAGCIGGTAYSVKKKKHE